MESDAMCPCPLLRKGPTTNGMNEQMQSDRFFLEQLCSCILVMEFGGLPSLLTVCLMHFFSTNII
jgi:hypothetical protein